VYEGEFWRHRITEGQVLSSSSLLAERLTQSFCGIHAGPIMQ
jgi:hypothetical protein